MARCRGQRYEAVLFDLDGTLVDTGTLILKSFDRTAREVLGVEAPSEELVSAVGLSLVEQFERVARAAILGGDYERPTQALYDRSPLPELREGTVAEEVGALRDRLVRHYSEVNSELHDEYIRP
ncbi:MAG: HAD family hydrolase, partial [Actinomycetes bacterium]|nr:HAD family hydrolase [Actinomycetes bacterium]